MKIVKPSVTFEACTPEPLKVIESAGRTCYKSQPTGDLEKRENFVRMLIKRGHESVLEHASATFRIVCDRGVTHELVRHRLCAYSQESTRFCNYAAEKFDGHISLIHPGDLTPQQRERRERHFWDVQALYDAEIAEGVKPQIARGILPTCLKTEIVHTANFREWRHIMRLRTSEAAHPQIREIIGPIHQWFAKNFPVMVEDIRPFESKEKSSAKA